MMTKAAMTEAVTTGIAQSTDTPIEDQLAATGKAFRPRRLLRFSLRTMLIVTAFLGIWLAVAQHRAHRQRDAVAAIREYGGRVRYDYQFPSGKYDKKDFDAEAESPWPVELLDRVGVDYFHDIVQVDLHIRYTSTNTGFDLRLNSNQSDAPLQYLPAFLNLRVLTLSGPQASDESMHYLASLRKLQRLSMFGATEVSNAGAAHLKNLRNLECVGLTDSKITDQTLMLLSDLPKIERLWLDGNRFTDQGVAYVSRNPRITELSISGRWDGHSPITDASLEHLGRMASLRKIDLQFTWVTGQALAQFTKNHPNCQVVEPVHVVD